MEAFSCVARLVTAALPITGWPDLLRHLVRSWVEATGSVVSIETFADSQALRAVGTPEQAEIGLSGLLTPAVPVDLAASPQGDASLAFDRSWECVTAGIIQGTVRATSATPAAALPTDDLNELAAVTGSLLAQARVVLAGEAEFQRRLTAAKLESLAEFSAGAGHEINNPVATIVGRAQLLLAGETDPDRRQSLSTIGGQALRIRDMIGDVMLFARPPEPVFSAVDLSQIAAEALDKFADDASQRGCRIKLEAVSPVVISADYAQASIVFAALIRNSLESGSSALTISVTQVQDKLEPAGLVTVSDNGKGLTTLEREHLFDPFFSGRQAGRGLGFGLAKAWRIMTGHGGWIGVDSEPGRTRFEVAFPVRRPGESKSGESLSGGVTE